MRNTNFSALPERKQLLYEQMARSYRTFERQKNTPWVPFEGRLIESKIAIISIAGAYLKDQKPFTNRETENDYRCREIPLNFNHEDLQFFATDWEPSEALADFNVILPIDRLVLLQKEGMIGKIHETVISIAGFTKSPKMFGKFLDKTNDTLKKAEVNGVLILPCSAQTSAAACQVAIHLEKKGLPTVLLTTFYEQALTLAPPRSAFINFPFGRPFGKANHVTLHTAILRDTLRLFEKAKTPGEVLCLNFVWSFGAVPNW
ncbi:MAG: glycine/sarcosine/betaine reductase selenoprotein B family protein [Candidatus Marinimicrobia bacterium]|jgi:glycine/betaine/sarcosine/D-proline reductase family selenoprotein B|nr:glycine/sarcosine/betaine reductase selenoprotein B family protein [Candidatus Neomarinimicrobiota bacterium]MCK9483075.1 glycine/sarcosine/betaine reductase selenoprotein B family protein [Candidatus Neomarinimicrobiota bacterium]MCK9559238.1 glycine/sarcosine/betaine reductase selenoprotein B family protein [Candidatus Neomarinimicrobiota bacterium]MDD5061265.1 glycine/sarcosine/betaine reductase selenoprotein B family protein [Candidatus Neomarinimicrobiota bacterium]MDD5230441.1 glycine/